MHLDFSIGRKIYLCWGFGFFALVAAATVIMDIALGQWLWIVFSVILAAVFGVFAYYGYFSIKNDIWLTRQGMVVRVGKDLESYRVLRWQDIDFIQARENSTTAFEVRLKVNSPTMKYLLEKYPQIWKNLENMPASKGHLIFYTDVIEDDNTGEQEVIRLPELVKLLNNYQKNVKMRETLPDCDPKHTWEVVA